jgi:cytochrome c556
MRRLLTAALAAILIAGPAAADTAVNSIKYRQNVMKAMSAHVSAFFMVNMGTISQPGHLKAHANALADLGAQTKDLFPAGTDVGQTEALPLIWQEPAEFAKAVKAVEDSTAALKKAVDAGDKAATGAAAKALGESCKGCHDRYRKEQKK